MTKKFTAGYGAARASGTGLQDEKLKPGKVYKASLGLMAVGMGVKKMKEKGQVMPPGMGAAFLFNKKKKEILGRKAGGVMVHKPSTKGFGAARTSGMGLQDQRLKPGKIYKAKKGSKKKPMGYASGDLARLKEERDRFKLIKNPARTKEIQFEIDELELQKKVDRDVKIRKARKSIPIPPRGLKGKDRLTSRNMFDILKQVEPQKKMGGGMMMTPRPIGHKGGVLVKVKIGRNKPTKTY